MEFTDQIGHTIKLNKNPERIISIVPSQSEFLWELGLRNELVGITKFCIHPEKMFQTIQRVGGTKKLDLDKIRELKPDLIIGNKEENEREQIEILQKEFPVWMSDIYTFEDAFKMMSGLGTLLGRQVEANSLVNSLRASLLRTRNLFSGKTLAYFIWYKPYMCAARSTFIDHVLDHLGFKNALSGLERYPEVDEELLRKTKPDICFLSSEPFPFKQQHLEELQKILPGSKILIVDGEVFSWYGTRLLHLEEYILSLPLRH